MLHRNEKFPYLFVHNHRFSALFIRSAKTRNGYFPKRLKRLVDEMVDEMARLPVVRRCYDQWLMLQGKVDGYHHDKLREQLLLSQQKEFRQYQNLSIWRNIQKRFMPNIGSSAARGLCSCYDSDSFCAMGLHHTSRPRAMSALTTSATA